MPNIEDLKLAQGPAKPATPEDIERDEGGITFPNLHRRIDDELAPIIGEEVAHDKNTLSVSAVNSYRTTEHIVHDEASTTSEIP